MSGSPFKKTAMTAYPSPSAPSHKALSILDLAAMKQRGEKISCLTAYDASFSALIDAVGIDVMLVGDSLGMVIQGESSTIPVTVEQMVYHSRCVTQARQRAFVITDLPFLSYATPATAIENAAKLMQSGGAQMVKMEGKHTETIRVLVNYGVPVCGHLGLLPQSIHQLGSYKVRGKEQLEADKIIADAQSLEQAGISALILECVPAALGKKISSLLKIPVIGIGAGVDCDGQVLVLYDMLGISLGKRPRFSKNFMQNVESIEAAIACYQHEVKNGLFPNLEQSY
jgi:3-methyl-2-oxobutanoate hydroxymethyltransferase